MSESIHKPVTAIVPVFSRSRLAVLEPLIKHKKVTRIIVVNNKSRNLSSIITKEMNTNRKLSIITLGNNLGKGNVIATGVEQAEDGLILLVGADFSGFNDHHIDTLIDPVFNQKVVMTIGYPPIYNWRMELFFSYYKKLAIQRAFWRDSVLNILPIIRDLRYGVEMILNFYFDKERVLIFELDGTYHQLKQSKNPFYQYSHDYVFQVLHLIRTKCFGEWNKRKPS